MKNKVLKFAKMYFESEEEVLTKIGADDTVGDCKLIPKHTDTHFIFEVVPDANNMEVDQSSDNLYTVDKSIEPDLREAKKLAAENFKTFPGNIKTVTDNDTCFQFEKVR